MLSHEDQNDWKKIKEQNLFVESGSNMLKTTFDKWNISIIEVTCMQF